MNRGRVGEERGGKETDECPLTARPSCEEEQSNTQRPTASGYSNMSTVSLS
jgi:hypothetical protein